MKWKAYNNYILIKPIKDRKINGIIIPETINQRQSYGEIASIGDGHRNEDGSITPYDDIKEGDTVLFNSYSVTELEIDKVKYLAVKYEDLLAKVEDEN